jgi:hypothetical protein
MAESKTVPTAASVDDFLASRATPAQLADCRRLMAILKRVTRQPPRMWGGRTGDMCLAGFSVRGKELVVYLVAESPAQPDLLSRLGKHRSGKSCLYLKSLDGVDAKVLEQLVASSVAEVRRRYPDDGAA